MAEMTELTIFSGELADDVMRQIADWDGSHTWDEMRDMVVHGNAHDMADDYQDWCDQQGVDSYLYPDGISRNTGDGWDCRVEFYECVRALYAPLHEFWTD